MKAKSARPRPRGGAKSAKADFDKASPGTVSLDGGLLTDNEKLAWLRLIRTPHIGVVTFWELLHHFGSAQAALDALPQFAAYGSRVSERSIATLASTEAELERATDAGMTLHAKGEAGYPPLLAEIEAPPPLLYLKGQIDVWKRPPIAVVGSRNATAAGLKFAGEISADLGRRGFLIVSGLARGIDGAAHRAAVQVATCAVLPGGLNAIYPPEHKGLAADITESGALISECPPGFIARARDFPRRNRIISGASLGVVVVEAAERSGSLITARMAGEQNRDVFAVPGHPYDPRAAGSNRLIKEGAIFTVSADDIEEGLQSLLQAWAREKAWTKEKTWTRQTVEKAEGAGAVEASASHSCQTPSKALESFENLGDAIEEVAKLLGFAPTDINDLCRLTGLEARHVHAALVSLDLAGRIERRGLRQVSLKL